VQDGDNRWSMGPLYSVQSLRLRSSFFIREYATTVEPATHIDFASQPQKDAHGRCVLSVSCGVEACAVNAYLSLQTLLTACNELYCVALLLWQMDGVSKMWWLACMCMTSPQVS